MKSITLLLIIITMGIAPVKGQHLSTAQGEGSLGIGFGLPYGGIGAKITYNLLDQFSLIGGLGYNLVGIGANAGLQYSLPSEKQSAFYFTGMYGYNSVIIMKDGMSGGGTYSGASFGVGLKINSLRSEGNFWDVGILAPIRPQKYKDAIDELKRSPYIQVESEPWPVLFYVGYNFNIGSL